MVLFITGKNRSRIVSVAFSILHAVSATWLLIVLLLPPHRPGIALLICLCTGMISGGWMLRTVIPLPLRIYFSLFFLTVVFFVASPSRFGNFLVHGDFKDRSPKRFHLYENYYLEQQQPLSSSRVRFKLIRQFGLFHQTLRRDVVLPVNPDSLKSTQPDEQGTIHLRLYSHTVDPSATAEFELSLSPATDSANHLLKR